MSNTASSRLFDDDEGRGQGSAHKALSSLLPLDDPAAPVAPMRVPPKSTAGIKARSLLRDSSASEESDSDTAAATTTTTTTTTTTAAAADTTAIASAERRKARRAEIDTKAAKEAAKNAALLELVKSLRSEIGTLRQEVEVLKWQGQGHGQAESAPPVPPPPARPSPVAYNFEDTDSDASDASESGAGTGEESDGPEVAPVAAGGAAAAVATEAAGIEEEEFVTLAIGRKAKGAKAGPKQKLGQVSQVSPVSAAADLLWEQLAAAEKERRRVARPARRTTKRAAANASAPAPAPATSATQRTQPPAPPAVIRSPPKTSFAKRRDSFFDESDEEEEGGGGRVSEFAWDDDDDSEDGESDSDGWSSDEEPLARVPLSTANVAASATTTTTAPVSYPVAAVTESAAAAVDEAALQAEAERNTLDWARGKDIIAMLATIHFVYAGAGSRLEAGATVLLPPAWAWVVSSPRADGSRGMGGGDVADRAAIADADVRKAYLKCVRVVHPDKQKRGGGLAYARVRAQAQSVFTALKDTYAAVTANQ